MTMRGLVSCFLAWIALVGAVAVGCGAANGADEGAFDASGADASAGDGAATAHGDATTPDGTAATDASVDGPLPPPYPSCRVPLDGGGFIAWLACEATRSCVYPCSTCPGATNACLERSACQASCAGCGAGAVPSTDACNGVCTSLTTDLENCGGCGHRCQATPHAGGARCSAGHCCPSIVLGDSGISEPTLWSPACSSCCFDGCPDAGGLLGTCVPERAD
jgi:hypothetical protein